MYDLCLELIMAYETEASMREVKIMQYHEKGDPPKGRCASFHAEAPADQYYAPQEELSHVSIIDRKCL